MSQPDLFAPFPAAAHRKARMRRAVDAAEHADADTPHWQAKARAFLVEYSSTHSAFLAEEVIHASRDKLPAPPDLRAWGNVFRAARKDGLIRNCGFSTHTKNACAKPLWSRAVPTTPGAS